MNRNHIIIGGFALLKILIHIPFLSRYGYHHDELYFLDCGQHLAFGYIDHAPMIPWIARLSDLVFGETLFGLRLFPLLAGAISVFVTGLLTQYLGGRRFAIALACLGVIIAPVYLRTAQMLAIPSFEPMFWVLGAYVIARIVRENDQKLWILLGVIIGLGMMTKHSTAFFVMGLLVGVVLTPLRSSLKSVWLYAGGGIAFLLFLPNIIWQIANDWPTLEFLKNLNERTMKGVSLLQFLGGQILYLHPLTAIVWIAGLVFFFSGAGKQFRIFGWIYVTVFLFLVMSKSKIYYLAPAYPLLFSGGGVALEQFVERSGKQLLKPVLALLLAIGGLCFAPLSIPMFSIDQTEWYIKTITAGAFNNVYELTGDLRGQFAWKKRVEIVAQVWNTLSAEEQKQTIIYANWYGTAGAVNYFGRAYHLPRAVSGHMTYYFWGPPKQPIRTVIVIDKPDKYYEFFKEVHIAAQQQLEHVNPWERTFTVLLCREPRMKIQEIWPRLKSYSF